jgi:iron complex outermembrane recepter protein
MSNRALPLRLVAWLFAGDLIAQDALTSFQEPDRVIVTGSLIPTAEEVTATPVDTFGRREIDRSGSVQVLEILQKREADITGAGNLGPTNANTRAGLTLGGSIISIRGLPTLVLYEGRRIADSAAISAGGFQFADVGLFPASLVSRIEVLKDGASALYGSDAVGGVINIFLMHDFKGVEIGYRYGFTPTSGTQNTLVYVIAGTGNEKTNITVGYQYYQSSGLFERERTYSVPFFGTTKYAGVTQSFFGPNFTSTRRFLLNPGLNSPFAAPGVSPGGATSQTPFETGPLATAYTARSSNFISNQFDLSRQPTSTLLENNQNVTASFTHSLLGKGLELVGDVLYSNNHNEMFLNANPLEASKFGGVVVIPAGHVSSGPGDPTIYNPFDFAIDGRNNPNLPVAVYNRYVNYPREFTNDTNFIRLLGGLRSQIGKNYSFEAAYYYSSYNIAYVNANLVRGDQLNAMIAGTARDANGNLIPSLDFFAVNPIGTGPGQVSAAQFATIFGSNIRNETSFQKVIDAKLTGFPFQMPAGLFGFALGGEYRTEGYSLRDSPEVFVNSPAVQQIAVSRNAFATYLELSVPLVGPQMKIPGIYSMDLSLAGRHEHFEGFNQDANVPKITFRYQPMRDLTLRASYSNSFVAPNLYQLYGPAATGTTGRLFLPAGPGPDADILEGEANVLTGSNPRLSPSTAQNWGAGLVYSPTWAPGLTISADYFNVLQQNIVGTLGSSFILYSVNRFGPVSPYYGLVHVGSFQGPLIPPTAGPFGNGTYYVAPNLPDLYVSDRNVNISATRVTGWDFSISYTWDLKRFGTLQLGANAAYYINLDFRDIPNSPYINFKGYVDNEIFGSSPAYRVNMLAEYRYQRWTLGFTGNYTPAMLNAQFASPNTNLNPRVEAFFQVDSRLAYSFLAPGGAVVPKGVGDPKGAHVRSSVAPPLHWYHGLTLTVGCNNMFNQQPPFVRNANSNTSLATYDPYGRLVYFQVSKKF